MSVTDTATWLDLFGLGKVDVRSCSFWKGGCQNARRELPNGDHVWYCPGCGYIYARQSCYDYERELLCWLTNKDDPNWHWTFYSFCNWVPKDPRIKALWDQFLGYDSSRNHQLTDAKKGIVKEVAEHMGGQR